MNSLSIILCLTMLFLLVKAISGFKIKAIYFCDVDNNPRYWSVRNPYKTN
jgi:hypothetical protein